MNGYRRELAQLQMPILTGDDGPALTNAFQRLGASRRDLQVNQGITENALDALIYRPWFPCSALIPTAGAASPTFGNVNTMECLNYAAGASYVARMGWPVPSAFWVNGTVSLRILWGGDTVSANQVKWSFTMSPTVAGAAPVNLTTTSALVPAVTTVNAVYDYTFTTTNNPVNSSHIATGFNVSRDGTDTYPGVARLYAFQLIYTPAAGH